MKKLLVAIVAVLVAATTYGQGQVNFQNIDALTDNSKGAIWAPGQTGVKGPGAGYTAGLYLVTGGVVGSAPLGTTTFFTDPGAEFLINPIDITLSGILGGQQATFRTRVWDNVSGSFATASGSGTYGESPDFTMTVGGDPGGGGAPLPSAPTQFGEFTLVTVPEPSTIAFGLLGAGALLLRRRRK
jgi:hypothetical protein